MTKYIYRALKKSSTLSKAVGLVLLGINAVYAWRFIYIAAITPYDAQYELIWVGLDFIDFPISLIGILLNFLVSFLILLTEKTADLFWIVLNIPIKVPDNFYNGVIYFQRLILPGFIFGVVGPIWYFMIPVFISYYLNLRKRPVKTK